jgi:hypothetical protein
MFSPPVNHCETPGDMLRLKPKATGGLANALHKRTNALFSGEHDCYQRQYVSHKNLRRRLFGSGNNFEIDLAQEHSPPVRRPAVTFVLTPHNCRFNQTDSVTDITLKYMAIPILTLLSFKA